VIPMPPYRDAGGCGARCEGCAQAGAADMLAQRAPIARVVTIPQTVESRPTAPSRLRAADGLPSGPQGSGRHSRRMLRQRPIHAVVSLGARSLALLRLSLALSA